MSNNGVMFKITAKTCKEQADAINSNKHVKVLEQITTEARKGLYCTNYIGTLSEDSKTKLEDVGFYVTKTSYNGDPIEKWLIKWN